MTIPVPRADSSKQLRWILVLRNNLETLFAERPDVWVGGNLLWYPVAGEPDIRDTPDILVVFGRPKCDRSSYRQWEEDNVPLTVVFEIQSPGDTYLEMDDKIDFYEEYGVEEYYWYDPDINRLKVFIRRGEVLHRLRDAHNFTSPRLGIRFDLSGPELVVYHSTGERFRTIEELAAECDVAKKRVERSEQHLAHLAQLTRKLLRGQVTPEDLRELERLTDESPSS